MSEEEFETPEVINIIIDDDEPEPSEASAPPVIDDEEENEIIIESLVEDRQESSEQEVEGGLSEAIIEEGASDTKGEEKSSESNDQIVVSENVNASDGSEDKSETQPETSEETKGEVKKKRSTIRRIIGIIEWLLIFAAVGLLVYIFICTAKGKAASVFGFNILHVVTGSMEPTISEDDYILVRKTDTSTLGEDDIVAYYSEKADIRGKLVIHRIIQVNEDGTFVTKGDANPVEDELAVRPDQIVGKYESRIWILQWVSSFIDPKKLLLLAVIIPMFLASIYEVATITKLVKGDKRKRNKKSEDKKPGPDKADKERADQETEEERIERWKREAIEEYRRTHPDGE